MCETEKLKINLKSLKYLKYRYLGDNTRYLHNTTSIHFKYQINDYVNTLLLREKVATLKIKYCVFLCVCVCVCFVCVLVSKCIRLVCLLD